MCICISGGISAWRAQGKYNIHWIPGGKTSGGVPEAITNTIPLKDTTITRIDVD